MIKIFFIIFFLLVLNNCSLNPNSKFWNENSNNRNNISKNKDDKVDTAKFEDESYEKIKEKIIQYGKNKDFPDINN